MELLLKAAVAGAFGAVAALIIKKDSPSIGLILGIVTAGFILLISLDIIGEIKSFTLTIAEAAGMSSALLTPIIKTVGIGIVTRLTSDVCRDAGQAAIASTIELVGSVGALYVALPLIKMVFQMINSLL